MQGYGTSLNAPQDMEFRWKKPTAHSCRSSNFRTHLQPSAEYPQGPITVHFTSLYTPQPPFTILETSWPVLKKYIFLTYHHYYTWGFTAHFDFMLAVLQDYMAQVNSRPYTHGFTSHYTSPRTSVYTNVLRVAVLQMTPNTASNVSGLATLVSPTD